jgi:hypothetical protein
MVTRAPFLRTRKDGAGTERRVGHGAAREGDDAGWREIKACCGGPRGGRAISKSRVAPSHPAFLRSPFRREDGADRGHKNIAFN